MIERRVERNERPLIGGNSAQHVLLVHATTERLHELLLVVLIARNFGDGISDTGRAHLEGVRDGQRRLLLERIDAAVPKLRLVVERVQDGWRVALTDTAVDANRRGPPASECACWIMAHRAGGAAQLSRAAALRCARADMEERG